MKTAGAAGANLTLHEKNPQIQTTSLHTHTSNSHSGGSMCKDRVGKTPLFLMSPSPSCIHTLLSPERGKHISAFNKVPLFMVELNDSLLNRSCLCDMCCLLESRNMLLKTCEEINGCTVCIRVHQQTRSCYGVQTYNHRSPLTSQAYFGER